MEGFDFEKRLDEILETTTREYIESAKAEGKDVIGMFAEHGFTSEEAVSKIKEHYMKLLTDDEYHKEFFGVTQNEKYLMDDGLTLEQARYVISHPCLEDAEDNCNYHKEHGRCVMFGCTLLNGWLYYRLEDRGKWIPIYSSWEKLPKGTLFLDEESLESGSWKDEIDSFLMDLGAEKKAK